MKNIWLSIFLFCVGMLSVQLVRADYKACSFNSDLSCKAEYYSLERRSQPILAPPKLGKMEYNDTGEPTIDTCRAKVNFKGYGAFLSAELTANALNIRGNQGSVDSMVDVPSSITESVTFTYNYPIQKIVGDLTVYGAAITCSIIRNNNSEQLDF